MSEQQSIGDLILHPVRMKIVQQLGGRTMTTAQLRKALPEVKQATLYRHIAALLDAEILAIIHEHQVRGATERTLALGERMAHVGQDELEAMDVAQLRSAFAMFLSNLSGDFDQFLDRCGTDSRNFLGFTRAPLYLDPRDLEALQTDFMKVLTPYLKQDRPEQRRINLATILIPDVDS